MIVDFLIVMYMLFHEITLSVSQQPSIQNGFFREIIHTMFTKTQKAMLIYVVGSVYIVACIIVTLTTLIIIKNDQILRKGNIILESLFKGFGHFFLILNHVLFIPSMTVFAEVSRCTKNTSSQSPNEFICLETIQLELIVFSAFGGLACIVLVAYTNLFLNSQFPNKRIPQATWSNKHKLIYSLWKVLYVYHYDLLGSTSYDVFLIVAGFLILIYQLQRMFEEPRAHAKMINWLELTFFTFVFVINFCVILESLTSQDILYEHLPIISVAGLFLAAMLIMTKARKNKLVISRDSRQMTEFPHEQDIILYVSLLLSELQSLKSIDKGQQHSTTPQIFTVISKHMEYCRNDDCICKKYEVEYDKKFSSIGSRRMTMRQSTSFSSVDYMLKKKIPIKISYETKCAIFQAEIADCIDRFLKIHPKSVGLKLQKSFFNHNFMNSSYKALFVQLENSHSCSSFIGKIQIYHLKTRIQEEMTQSEASPFSIDITSCLKFERKRVVFEQYITDLCLVCETFWHELTQSEQDYNVDKVHALVLEISKTIIRIKEIFNQLCAYNPQNIDVIQNYALIYRYILRDEFRFNDIINNLNQLKKTNKLEQIRELLPKFFDSDNYAMILVSGDVKDLGRIMKANRGVENIFGYMPNELQGYKINKVMPRLFSSVHDEFIQGFLRRGHSTFIDKNQFLLIENKMRFLQMTLAYIKVMVDLKVGLVFVSFFKLPLKVPNNAEGNQYIKHKDAHYILCDSKGQIQGISYNCMRNLGIPPTIISKAKNSFMESNQLANIDAFSPNILGPEYEFDLPKGMHFTFNTTIFKGDKFLAKEFHELTGRMRKYNIFVSLRKYEFRLSPVNIHEVLLFTLDILSFQHSEIPITIPVDKTDEATYSQYSGTTVSSANNNELRTSKFKEFKTQVQDLKVPSKISQLRKITAIFFVFLLAVFSLNYALCATQNQAYMQRVDMLDILFQLSDKVPSTTRYIRTCVNIANGFENNTNEVINDRFSYYMGLINDNAAAFTELQQSIQTQYSSSLTLEDVTIQVSQLQTDYTIMVQNSTISSALNIFSSKSLQFSTLSMANINDTVIPYLSFDFNLSQKNLMAPSNLQQDLYFMLENGLDSIPNGLIQLSNQSQTKIDNQSATFKMISLVIGIISIFVNFIIIPIVYPMLVHYERLAYYILHSMNKLTKKFLENEVKCCNQLFNYMGKKHGSGINDKNGGLMMKKPEERLENKQLMKVNPKLSKYVLEQQRKKKNHAKDERKTNRSKRSKQSGQDEEEEKITVEDLDHHRAGRKREDEASALLDEELDEDHSRFRSRGGNVQTRSGGAASRKGKVFRRRRTGVSTNTYLDPNNASVTSLDESTIQTSIEMNSSTNKSSDNDTTSQNENNDSDSDSSSSQSNYTHYTNVSHWNNFKQGAYSNAPGNPAMRSNFSFNYDMTHAKSSELPAGDNYQEKDNNLNEEEKEFKRQVRERQGRIKQTLKRRKIKKVLWLVVFIILISIYLGVNTMYTTFVFQYEQNFQGDINIIDQRILCYPQTLTLVKETISRNHSMNALQPINSTYDTIGSQILSCYSDEMQFSDIIVGKTKVDGVAVLSSQYLRIALSLEKDAFCQTLYQLSNTSQYQLCLSSYDGINELGLDEALNYILRESQLLINNYKTEYTLRSYLIWLLNGSRLTEVETIMDYFTNDGLLYERASMISQIKSFAQNLFNIFDILFSVFVSVCFLIAVFGVVYIIKQMQRKIIQIYHIVLLIPYGERTKRELNELLKITL